MFAWARVVSSIGLTDALVGWGQGQRGSSWEDRGEARHWLCYALHYIGVDLNILHHGTSSLLVGTMGDRLPPMFCGVPRNFTLTLFLFCGFFFLS
ncbi:hypothetical protein B0J18DRAFT_186805 [Chaetomium sp. MPI-SDFR-AT-0129]|nr:hypothetical protein B0J18DRAFT_186805 [Chaetomium sp. MPI-SDFR-AT-0129]